LASGKTIAVTRSATFHQDLVALALLAIKVLHAQGLAAFGMLGKLAHGAKEMPVFANLQG
jgi:hypothetical protein